MLAAVYTLPAYISSRTEEIAEARVINDQRQEVTGKDLIDSIVPAVAVSLVERLGGKVVLGTGGVTGVKSAVKATAGAAAIEGATEFVQEGIEYLGETYGTKKEISLEEMIDRQLAGLVAGAGMGGTIRGASATVEAVANRTGKNVETSILSMTEQETIDQIVMYAQASKTKGRAQDRFKQFMEMVSGDREIHIDAESVTEAIQKGEQVPDYAAEQLNGLGTDITVTLDQFATDFASNETLMQAIRPHVKLSPDTLTPNELDKFDDPAIKELLARAEKSRDIKTEADKIYEQVKEQLVKTGRQSEATAKYSAVLLPAYITVKSADTGISVKEIYESMGVKIIGPTQAATIEDRQGKLYYQDQPLSEMEVTVEAIEEETGRVVTIQENAEVALKEANDSISDTKRLIKCLRG
jgi:hypothetical protein